MSADPERDGKKEKDHRTLINFVAAIAILLLAIGALWLMRALDQSRKMEQCLEAKRPDCAKLAPAEPEATAPGY